MALSGDREGAVRHFSRLVNQFPDSARAHYELASALDPLSREEEAIPHYRRAIELGLPKDLEQEALLGLGSSLRIVGSVEESVRLLNEATKRFPLFMPLRAFKALSHLAAGRENQAAISELEELMTGGKLGAYQAVVGRYFDELTIKRNPPNKALQPPPAGKRSAQ